MRVYVLLMVAVIALMFACGGGPFTGPGGACPNCNNTPPPTTGPGNGNPCVYLPPSTVPFYQMLAQAGLTQKGNNTCIPMHRITEIQFDGNTCTVTCVNGSPAPSPFPGITLGAYYMDLYADWSEDGTSFNAGLTNKLMSGNYPYNINGAGYSVNGYGPPSIGDTKPMKYNNPNILHANEQIDPGTGFGSGVRACTKPGTGIKFIGTPTNPTPAQIPPGLLGDDSIIQANLDIEHTVGQTTTPFRIYFTDTSGCKNATPAPATPVQAYLGYLGATHLQRWIASLQTGAMEAGSICAFTNSNPVCSDTWPDAYAKYENDQSATSIANQTTCSTAPCNPASAVTTTQHWASDQAMVNDRVALFNAISHQFGTSCATAPLCIANGTGEAEQFNGLTNAIVNANACYLYTAALQGNYASTNVQDGEFEQPTSAFNGRVVEPRDWAHVVNCTSDIFANTNGQVFFNDHQTLQANYQFYYDSFGVQMLVWSNGRVTSALRLDDIGGGGGNAGSNPNLTVYPLQMLMPDPTANGSPALGKFVPPANNPAPPPNGTDANGYDPNSNLNGDFGTGCDLHDAASDHGAADLLTAGSVGGATPSGSCLKDGGSAVNCTTIGLGGNDADCREDYKGNRVGVYVREFANVYYKGSPITNAPISSAANYMAVVVNPSAQAHIVACADLPLEGGANYLHIVTALPATPTQNAMDMVNGGSLAATTGFTCGTTPVAAESTLILVK